MSFLLSGIPIPFSRKKPVHSFLFHSPQIFYVGVAMHRNQKFQFFAGFKFITFPATCNSFLLTAYANFTERRTSAFSAPFFTPEFHHKTQCIVAFHIVGQGFSERSLRERCCKRIIVRSPEFFSKIPCQVGDFSFIPVAIAAIETTIREKLIFFCHLHQFPNLISWISPGVYIYYLAEPLPGSPRFIHPES